MNKVLAYSLLLVAGLVGSQVVPPFLGDLWPGASLLIRLATMVALAFIMIHVGYEFEIDRSRPKEIVLDYGIAATAAAFPWIFVSLYFVIVLGPVGAWSDLESWKPALSLALNLVLTGAFIAIVKKLLQGPDMRGRVLPNGG